MPFEELPHTGDIQYKVTGKSKQEVLEDSIRAMFSTITDLSAVEAKDERTIEATGKDDRELLVNCLRGALSLFNDEGFIARDCQVTCPEPNTIGDSPMVQARLAGELFDLARHPYRTEIKGVTHHGAEVLQQPAGWSATFTLDL
jgi:SHS2 domain-containing protein